jgi:DNA-binding Xre family transcriptional regulator
LLAFPSLLSALSYLHYSAGKTERITFKVMRSVSTALGVEPNHIAEFRRALET